MCFISRPTITTARLCWRKTSADWPSNACKKAKTVSLHLHVVPALCVALRTKLNVRWTVQMFCDCELFVSHLRTHKIKQIMFPIWTKQALQTCVTCAGVKLNQCVFRLRPGRHSWQRIRCVERNWNDCQTCGALVLQKTWSNRQQNFGKMCSGERLHVSFKTLKCTSTKLKGTSVFGFSCNSFAIPVQQRRQSAWATLISSSGILFTDITRRFRRRLRSWSSKPLMVWSPPRRSKCRTPARCGLQTLTKRSTSAKTHARIRYVCKTRRSDFLYPIGTRVSQR